jgi:hypothetical protein
MRTLLLMLAVCLTFTAASMAQNTQQTSPNSPSMQQDSQPGSMANSENKGDKKIRGCIRSENGNYMLESKHHKMITLTGSEDFAPHVGHTVTLYGTFLPGPAAGAGAENAGTTAGASSAGQGSNFQVSKMYMVSESCILENQKGMKSNKGSAPDRH